MSTITVRAPDSVTALELVQRRLGDDALILSNDWVDGQIEITASDEMPAPRPDARSPQQRPLVDVLVDDRDAADTRAAPPTPTSPPELGPVAAPAAASPQETRADMPTASVVRLPKFMDKARARPFGEVLAEELRRTAPAATSAPTAQDLRARLLTAGRVILVGPAGAGKSQVALQLALMRRLSEPDLSVNFAFHGSGSQSDGAFLARKSHLLGMDTVFTAPGQLDAPTPRQMQVVVISGRAADPVALARDVAHDAGTETVLVLPAGLRPDRLARQSGMWADLSPGVILTQDGPALPRDEADARDAGLIPLWEAAPERLIDGLRPIGGDRIAPVADSADPVSSTAPLPATGTPVTDTPMTGTQVPDTPQTVAPVHGAPSPPIMFFHRRLETESRR